MVVINPWGSSQYEDYRKLMEQFGIGDMSRYIDMLPNPPPIFRRSIVFGERGFNSILGAIRRKDPFVILTGLSPSGKMHLGHKMVIDQIKYYQKFGAFAYIAVADLEAYGARGVPLKVSERIAIEEYVKNYLALGLDPERFQVYFQSKRIKVLDTGYFFSRFVKWGEMEAIYGFNSSYNMAHIMAPIVQIGDIMHVQLEEFGGPRPTLVPVGVDQDPHLRLCRDVAERARALNFMPFDQGIMITASQEGRDLLREVERRLKEVGYSDLDVNVPYGVIKVFGAREEDEYLIERILIEVQRGKCEMAMFKPSSTYHRMMTGLTGGKMSSSKPETAIFLTDSEEEIWKKVMNAITGGRSTAKEQRELGGIPERCSVFEIYAYHLVEDDEELMKIREECSSGERLCGPCKKEAYQRLSELLREIQERRESISEKEVKEVVSYE